MIPDWKIPIYTNQLRDSVSLEMDDIISDIDFVVSEAGYTFAEERFGDDFSGMSKSLGRGNYLIAFNKDHYWSEKFRRFTIAHELGHLTIPEHRALLDKKILHRSKPEFNSKDGIEIEADKFAINLLAPRNPFQSAIQNLRFNSESINKLSEQFNISTYAAALRFIELTNLSCSMIINRTNGYVLYEKRSKNFNDGFRHSLIFRQRIPQTTHTYDFINKISGESDSIIDLNCWYPDLQKQIKANESVVDLGYNGSIITMIEPHCSTIYEE
jgi:Zn-dependent peptidase ImmA (M78 family)